MPNQHQILKKKVSSSAKIERTRTHVLRDCRKAAAGPVFSHPLQFLKAFEHLVNGSFPGDAKEISSAVHRGMCKKETASHHSETNVSSITPCLSWPYFLNLSIISSCLALAKDYRNRTTIGLVKDKQLPRTCPFGEEKTEHNKIVSFNGKTIVIRQLLVHLSSDGLIFRKSRVLSKGSGWDQLCCLSFSEILLP